jgi:hypothetical protein
MPENSFTRFTPEDDAALLAMKAANVTHATIGRRLGRTTGAIHKRLKLLARNGVTAAQPFWTAEKDAELLRLADRQSMSMIARRFGCTRDRVKMRLRKLGKSIDLTARDRERAERHRIRMQMFQPLKPGAKPRETAEAIAARTIRAQTVAFEAHYADVAERNGWHIWGYRS